MAYKIECINKNATIEALLYSYKCYLYIYQEKLDLLYSYSESSRQLKSIGIDTKLF